MEVIMQKHLLFVYGTLLAEYPNHRVIEGSRLLGSATTNNLYTMHSNGYYPAITLQETHKITGEVYELDEEMLFERVDSLEGYSPNREHNHYQRKLITVTLDSGKQVNAWVYYQHVPSHNMTQLPSGSFAEHFSPGEYHRQ
jgi:gamma-glutamylcyclotransferase (GGCT)/AIG2-like uncharacterized protein YtfP